MFGVLVKMAFPEKDDELGPGIDFDLITLLLSPAGAALGKTRQILCDDPSMEGIFLNYEYRKNVKMFLKMLI